MATINDISIIDSNAAEATQVDSGSERTLCSPSLCGSKNLTIFGRTISSERQFNLELVKDYHLVYVMEGSTDGLIHFDGEAHVAEEGAGVLLQPGESARFEAVGSNLELLHMITPKPPAGSEKIPANSVFSPKNSSTMATAMWRVFERCESTGTGMMMAA